MFNKCFYLTAFFVGILCSAGTARAGFSIKNESAHPATVAVGFVFTDASGAEHTIVKGWYIIQPLQKALLIADDLKAVGIRYCFVYGKSQTGIWGGNHTFRVHPGRFTETMLTKGGVTTVIQESSDDRAWTQAGFMLVDNKNASNHTLLLK